MSKIAKRYCCVRTLYVGIVAPADSRIGEAIPSSFSRTILKFLLKD